MFRPGTTLGTEITPSLSYYHHRSGEHINFYCPGFEIGWEPERLQPEENQFFYDPSDFERFRKEIERRSKWRYSGGTDLLLVNARFDETEANLDFSSAIAADLIKMKAVAAIDSIDSYIEKIIRSAETQDGSDPTWGFSDKLGVDSIFSGLKGLLIDALPKGLQKEGDRAFHYVVSDLSL